MEFTPLPFEYQSRYIDHFREWGLPLELAAIMEERDRQLEDYLATQEPAKASRVIRTTSTSIANVTQTTLSWESVDFDDLFMWNASTPTVLTARTPGRYLAITSVIWDINTSGARSLTIETTGEGGETVESAPSPAGHYTRQHLSAILGLEAGDTVSVSVFQSSGGALNIIPGAGGPGLSVLRFGGLPSV